MPSLCPSSRRLTLLAAIVGTFGVSAASSSAAVILSLTDQDGAPNMGFGSVGSTFTLTVTLTSTAELTTGLTYFLQDPTATPAAPRFQIVARDTTGSTYSFLTTDDATVLATPGSLLNPSNDFDLGGGVANLNAPNGPGSYFVANLTFAVLPGTPQGTYSIQFTPRSVASGPGPDFQEFPVTRFDYTVVTDVPEPTSASLLLFAAVFGGARRRQIVRR